ncbi:MAG TPA: phosphatase PAP2 family protein [Allosphingosinicella sp.]|jgi:undecaprenyl-diphosphatase
MRRLSAFSFWTLFGALTLVWVAMLLLGGPTSPIDRTILAAAQSAPLVPAARLVTHLGDGWFVLGAGAAVAAAAAFLGRARAGLLLLGTIVSGKLLVEVQKTGFDRARPDPHGHYTAVHNLAFPSGHSANAMLLFLGTAVLATAGGRMRGGAVAAALLVVMTVGLCRLVLGVHWPSDVIGGWAFGAGWTLLLLRLAGGTPAPERH